jgi:Cys-rich four helix bundle protein (predicted Tat secretion target)
MALHRRELLLVGAGLVVAKATATTLACAKETTVNEEDPETKGDKGTKKTDAKAGGAKTGDAKAGDAKADPHAGHEGHEGHEGAGGSAHASFAAATADCVEKGDACLQHCIAALSKGDTSMAECAAAVNDMLAVCRGMGTLALSGSKHLQQAAQLCLAVCTDCAAACEPHVGHHDTCKACHEACLRSIDEAKKLA